MNSPEGILSANAARKGSGASDTVCNFVGKRVSISIVLSIVGTRFMALLGLLKTTCKLFWFTIQHLNGVISPQIPNTGDHQQRRYSRQKEESRTPVLVLKLLSIAKKGRL